MWCIQVPPVICIFYVLGLFFRRSTGTDNRKEVEQFAVSQLVQMIMQPSVQGEAEWPHRLLGFLFTHSHFNVLKPSKKIRWVRKYELINNCASQNCDVPLDTGNAQDRDIRRTSSNNAEWCEASLETTVYIQPG